VKIETLEKEIALVESQMPNLEGLKARIQEAEINRNQRTLEIQEKKA
jgi:hypothetical protein